jgi:FAD/FMN-containing dehydrogenase
VASADGLVPSLRVVVGDDHVITDPDRVAGYTRDWTGGFVGWTAAVVRPRSTPEVAEIVRLCRASQTALVPQGGNTGLVGGSVPLAGEIVLSTERMVGVTDVDPDGGQLTAWAGTTVAEVQAAAAAAGWRYGVDFAARDTATVGGTVATDAGGLRVLRFGSTRRQVLGLEAVLGTGDVVSRLGGLVKDNTGYDLAGLLCGSEGTLGVVCRVRLALVPAVGETVTALVGFGSIDAAVRAVGIVRRSVPGLEAAEVVLADGARLVAEHTGVAPVLDPGTPVQLVLEAVGPPDPTDALAAALERLDGVTEVAVASDPVRAAGLWHVREAHTEAIARIGVPRKYDVTLPGSRLGEFCEAVPALVSTAAPEASTWLFGHIADGNIHVNVTGTDGAACQSVDRAVLGAVLERGGSVSAEHGIGTAKRDWLLPDRGPGDVAAMRAIKAALDPDGICNPNVLLPEL